MTAALAIAIVLQTDPVKADIDLAVRLWKEFKMPIPPASALPKIDFQKKDNALIIYGMVDFRTSQDYVFFSGTRKSTNAINSYSKELWHVDQPLPWSAESYSGNTIQENGRFPESAITSTAVQCACIGLEPIARQIVDLNKCQNQPFDSNIESWTGAPINNSLAAHTAFLIYSSYLNDILDGSTDRKVILERFIRLERHHFLKDGPPFHLSLESWGIKDRIKELRATINQPSAKGDAVQAAVNDLINLKLENPFHDDSRKDPIYKKVIGFGKDAIPYLKKELKHPRLTRTLIVSLGNNITHIVSVKSIASKMINELNKK